ncbi:phage tail protein [Pseudomonas caspiana]|uniref:phage tail-collar fiber domain-containing protein n=1 Tax=Pseudomonas caspiana TaxID=1451454 RepID=UPI0032EEBC3C
MINQNSQFFATLTNVGAAKQANADALGVPWKITQMAIGDANGADPVPDVKQTKLINEVRRAPLNQLKIDPANASVIIAEQVIPADVGGFWIREIGLYDADGDFVAVANCAPSFKPLLVQGSGRTQIVRLNIIVSNAGSVELKIDSTVVLATRAYVDAAILNVLPKNKTAGQFTRVKVNEQGIVVSGDNPDTLDGNNIKNAYTKEETQALVAQSSSLPVGAMFPFSVDSAPPGFLEVNGELFQDTVYPDLAVHLNKKHNRAGDAAGWTRLPESRGEFFRGWDHGRGVDVGRVLGSYQAGQLESHSHSGLPPLGAGKLAHDDSTESDTGVLRLDRSDSTAAFGGEETRPRNIAVMWCIKAWAAPVNQGSIDIAALAASLSAAMPRYYLTGFGLSMNATSPQTTIDLAPGCARAGGSPVVLTETISGVLQDAGAWSAGSGGNKLDTGVRAEASWYHVFVIRRLADGAADMLLSKSLTAAVVPNGYELIRRIASIGTAGSGVPAPARSITPFINVGRHFWWVTPVKEAAGSLVANTDTNAITLTMTVPPGVRVIAKFQAAFTGNASSFYARSTDAAQIPIKLLVATNSAASLAAWGAGLGMNTSDIDFGSIPFDILTDTGRAIALQYSQGNAGFYSVTSLGYTELS